MVHRGKKKKDGEGCRGRGILGKNTGPQVRFWGPCPAARGLIPTPGAAEGGGPFGGRFEYARFSIKGGERGGFPGEVFGENKWIIYSIARPLGGNVPVSEFLKNFS